ncbi:hypothetical protein LCGC14_0660220 [marine sediment metagenome]|uniref:Uncharacterized protein n=1 Tax=marine sediment metagenome TaxID=412755 RepID=A0A0F9QYR8_9ZZZZ
MKRLLYLLVLVGAVSLTAYISASGEVYHDGGKKDCKEVGVVPSVTPIVTATSTQTPVPTPKITELPKVNCGADHDHDCGHGNDGDRSDNDNPHGGPSKGKPGSGRDEEQGGTEGGRYDK